RLPSTELVGGEAQGRAVVELVPLGEPDGAAFPAVDVVADAVDARQGGVVAGSGGLDQLPGHLCPAPRAGLPLPPQPFAERRTGRNARRRIFPVHRSSPHTYRLVLIRRAMFPRMNGDGNSNVL